MNQSVPHICFSCQQLGITQNQVPIQQTFQGQQNSHINQDQLQNFSQLQGQNEKIQNPVNDYPIHYVARYHITDLINNETNYLCQTCFRVLYGGLFEQDKLIHTNDMLNRKLENQRREITKLINSNKFNNEKLLENKKQIQMQFKSLNSQYSTLCQLTEKVQNQKKQIKELLHQKHATVAKILKNQDRKLKVSFDDKVNQTQEQCDATEEETLKIFVNSFLSDLTMKLSSDFLNQFSRLTLLNHNLQDKIESSQFNYLKTRYEYPNVKLAQQLLELISKQIQNIVSDTVFATTEVYQSAHEMIQCLELQNQIQKTIEKQTDQKIKQFMMFNPNMQITK
ncbi:hypothetical protein OXYTRIMIC_749 [Oxytricha trifallax]|uniref:Uncharacterized protein n=1 Tax=Oxytricha trifallax TaxID=1172189 RepID=A0A073I0U0_9SPIT|nr:hypothetical protein OXYTRIMIC_749 [Oxytricha trifallax]